MAERGEPDGIAGELARIEADHQARLDEIDASYEAHLEELRALDADPERWPDVLANFRARGRVVMTEAQASAERSRMIREAEADRLRRLQALKLRQDLRAEALLVAQIAPVEAAAEPPPQGEQAKSKRGKWEKDISESEANKAVEIYLKNSRLTPWDVYTRYVRVQDRDEPGWLSRRMVERLIDDLEGDKPLLVWDATAVRNNGELGRLRLPSGVLWANFGRGVLPRREPPS